MAPTPSIHDRLKALIIESMPEAREFAAEQVAAGKWTASYAAKPIIVRYVAGAIAQKKLMQGVVPMSAEELADATGDYAAIGRLAA